MLADPAYQSANLEFRDALEEYRKGDYGDCLTKCGSAFESIMKVICDRKGWPYNSNDTAGPLIKVILANTNLDSYFESSLLIVATLRNRLSTSHGAGTGTRQPSRHLARYAINATASNILLIADEAGES